MILELHLIQNFAPSNLNRSDTGSPKDCDFGGVRRARVSSQCFKRAIRDFFKTDQKFAEAHREKLAVRTKRLADEVTKQLIAKGRDETAARQVVEAALNGVKLSVKEDGKTQYLLFLGQDEIGEIVRVCDDNFETLQAVVPGPSGKESSSAKDKKKAAKDAVPADVRAALERTLVDENKSGKAADLALFGRMMADLPTKNVDAASQVAHAISTHKVGVEFDFYTAVDDIRPEDTSGADMLGTIEFNSACFYRYLNLGVEKLKENLDGEDLNQATIEAFIRAAVEAVPTGKQNSMAAQNPPMFVLAVARKSGMWSLANAFVKPVRPNSDGDLIENSIDTLDRHWNALASVYGDEEIAAKHYFNLTGKDLTHLNGAKVGTLRELIQKMLGAVSGGEQGA